MVYLVIDADKCWVSGPAPNDLVVGNELGGLHEGGEEGMTDRRYSNEIQMRKMLVAELCGAKTGCTTLPDLAMAHRVVSGLESLPKRIGREK